MSDSVLPLLLTLNQRLLKAEDLRELGFIIANDTWQVLKYRQACVYLPNRVGRISLAAVTGLEPVTEATPFSLWLDRVNKHLGAKQKVSQPCAINQGSVPVDLAKGWSEWWPEQGYYVPLMDGKRLLGAVYLVRDEPWRENDQQLITLLSESWQFCLSAQVNKRRPSLISRLVNSSKALWLLVAAIVALGFVPVRLSAIAEAEIISLDTQVVSSPAQGVVEQFFVEPNTQVERDTALFQLDRSELDNRIEVLKQTLAIAKADLDRVQQQSFSDAQSKAELAALRGKVREQELTLAASSELANRMLVTADKSGLFVYSDPNDWVGKPVVTGERIGELAQEADLGVMLWLPANDAISLQLGTDVRVFLQVDPLNAISAELTHTSYQVAQSPDGVAAYALRGRLEEGSSARIGLRGVAKVYGEPTNLAYWVFRRPLGAMRQWLGL